MNEVTRILETIGALMRVQEKLQEAAKYVEDAQKYEIDIDYVGWEIGDAQEAVEERLRTLREPIENEAYRRAMEE